MEQQRQRETIRFWDYINGDWVKLSLRDGQEVEFSSGGRHEEGYACTHKRYTREGDVIRCEIADEGRDCDGRYSRYYEGQWSGEMRELDGLQVPQWERLDASQRDYSAEAMGY